MDKSDELFAKEVFLTYEKNILLLPYVCMHLCVNTIGPYLQNSMTTTTLVCRTPVFVKWIDNRNFVSPLRNVWSLDIISHNTALYRNLCRVNRVLQLFGLEKHPTSQTGIVFCAWALIEWTDFRNFICLSEIRSLTIISYYLLTNFRAIEC